MSDPTMFIFFFQILLAKLHCNLNCSHRAPLFEVQTDDWDCSCAVVWDPIHADCAVPQVSYLLEAFTDSTF